MKGRDLTFITKGSEIGLEPCPFCGKEAWLMTGKGESYVECSNCGAKTKPHASSRTAEKRWNRRVKARAS